MEGEQVQGLGAVCRPRRGHWGQAESGLGAGRRPARQERGDRMESRRKEPGRIRAPDGARGLALSVGWEPGAGRGLLQVLAGPLQLPGP